MTELWEWMERPKWYRFPVSTVVCSNPDFSPPKSEEDMTPEERDEWVKSLKRSHDESVRPTREEV